MYFVRQTGEKWRNSHGYKLLSISFLDPRDFTSQDSRMIKLVVIIVNYKIKLHIILNQICAKIFN